MIRETVNNKVNWKWFLTSHSKHFG